ncbi:Glucanosyltransferase-domain-containing protein [Xylaria sp. CBS 124048]|nr:Glucanosyltransferase-domain-containing protein [Xylaria sp. CBS 124048]
MRSSILAVLASAAATYAIPTIEAFGNKFFTSDGKQFYIKGVAYQLLPDDPLVDTAQCSRDIALMKTIGVNTIRVYHVDPTANHDGCMKAFADAGIYVLVDMDTFSTYILPNEPTWTQEQFDAYSKVMDAFHGYDNLMGLFVGNEIIADKNQSLAAPFIKSASRDLKAYRDSKGYRQIPVGYSAADIAELRPYLQDYLTCGGNASENVDFFSLNSYQWCDPSSYTTSGYANLEALAKDYPVPMFFSETGCNVPGPRLFEDQAAIFGDNMNQDWCGAIIYEWIQEQNHYGMISYGPSADATAGGDGFVRSGTPTPVLPDFDNLSKQWAQITVTGISKSDYTPNPSTRPCPAATPNGWLLDGNVAPPPLGASLAALANVASATASATSSASTSAPTSASGSASTSASGSASNSGSGSGSSSDSSSSATSGSDNGTTTSSGPSASHTKSAASGSQVASAGAVLAGAMFMVAFWL